MRQVSSLKADQLELTSACFSSLLLMKPLRSVSTVWNHWYASGLTPGGMLPTEKKNKTIITFFILNLSEVSFLLLITFHHCIFYQLLVQLRLWRDVFFGERTAKRKEEDSVDSWKLSISSFFDAKPFIYWEMETQASTARQWGSVRKKEFIHSWVNRLHRFEKQ